jgi:hypothetical protein
MSERETPRYFDGFRAEAYPLIDGLEKEFVQALAAARIEGARAMQDAAAKICRNGVVIEFARGMSSTTEVRMAQKIEDMIRALSPEQVVADSGAEGE